MNHFPKSDYLLSTYRIFVEEDVFLRYKKKNVYIVLFRNEWLMKHYGPECSIFWKIQRGKH